jgi:hypothetical protein
MCTEKRADLIFIIAIKRASMMKRKKNGEEQRKRWETGQKVGTSEQCEEKYRGTEYRSLSI